MANLEGTAPDLPRTYSCTLGIHDDAFSKLEVLLNTDLLTSCNVLPGKRLRISSSHVESPRQVFKKRTDSNPTIGISRRTSCMCNSIAWDIITSNSGVAKHAGKISEISYVFVVPKVAPESLQKHPNLEVRCKRATP